MDVFMTPALSHINGQQSVTSVTSVFVRLSVPCHVQPPGLPNLHADDPAAGTVLQWPMHDPGSPIWSVHHVLPMQMQVALVSSPALLPYAGATPLWS